MNDDTPRLRHNRCPYCGAGFYLFDAPFICDICDPDPFEDKGDPTKLYPHVEAARAETAEPIMLPLPAHVVSRWSWVGDFKARAEAVLSKALPAISLKMQCGHVSTRRRCPTCRATLPDNIHAAMTFIVSVLGPSGVGKSHFIAALIDVVLGNAELDRRGALDRAGHTIKPVGKTADEYRDRYYEPVYVQRTAFGFTPKLKQSHLARVPLVYEIAPNIVPGPGVTNLSLFDVPGEDAVNRRDLAVNGRHILNSDAVICMLGPAPTRDTRDKLDAALGLKAIDTLIEAATRIYGRRGANGRALPIPIAVVVTKSDILAERGTLPPELTDRFEHGSIDDPAVHAETIAHARGLVELSPGLRELPGRLAREFANVGYFAVSSLGFAPDGTSLSRRPEPHRVEEPLFWLLATRRERWSGR